jgi:hypothetical protein
MAYVMFAKLAAADPPDLLNRRVFALCKTGDDGEKQFGVELGCKQRDQPSCTDNETSEFEHDHGRNPLRL